MKQSNQQPKAIAIKAQTQESQVQRAVMLTAVVFLSAALLSLLLP